MKGIIVDDSVLNIRLLSHYVIIWLRRPYCVVEFDRLDWFQVEVHREESKLDIIAWFVLGFVALNKKSATWCHVQTRFSEVENSIDDSKLVTHKIESNL